MRFEVGDTIRCYEVKGKSDHTVGGCYKVVEELEPDYYGDVFLVTSDKEGYKCTMHRTAFRKYGCHGITSFALFEKVYK